MLLVRGDGGEVDLQRAPDGRAILVTKFVAHGRFTIQMVCLAIYNVSINGKATIQTVTHSGLAS
jgi:hypothetical protein